MLSRKLVLSCFEVFCVLLIGAVVRFAYENPTVHFDEFFHILAASSWVTDGTLSIADGSYHRARFFTYVVGVSYQLFGESVWASRLPSLVAGVVLIGAVFWWSRRVSGRLAGWLAAMFLCFAPGSINLSQMSRFYMLQALCLWLTSISVYYLVTVCRSWGSGVMTVLFGFGMAVLAASLQISSLIGLGALGLWAAVILGWRLRRWESTAQRRGIVIVLIVLVLAVTALGVQEGRVVDLFDQYQYAPAWADADRINLAYYHRSYLESYGLFWFLFPVAFIVAIAKCWTPALFCGIVFSVVFVLHSFGGQKAERYLFYAFPFFFIVWGMALSRILPALQHQFAQVLGRLFGSKQSLIVVVGWFGVTVVFGLSLHYTQASHTTRDMINPINDIRHRYLRADWASAVPVLRQIEGESELVVASAGPAAIYYLGRVDVCLSRTVLGDRAEFAQDDKVGHPVISTPSSLDRIMQESASGLIVVEEIHWRRNWGVPEQSADFILRHTESVPLPDRSGLMAFRWPPRF